MRINIPFQKPRIWSQSWIYVEIQDLDIHIFENISKNIDLDLMIFDVFCFLPVMSALKRGQAIYGRPKIALERSQK